MRRICSFANRLSRTEYQRIYLKTMAHNLTARFLQGYARILTQINCRQPFIINTTTSKLNDAIKQLLRAFSFMLLTSDATWTHLFCRQPLHKLKTEIGLPTPLLSVLWCHATVLCLWHWTLVLPSHRIHTIQQILEHYEWHSLYAPRPFVHRYIRNLIQLKVDVGKIVIRALEERACLQQGS